jgi:hypothetical protein
LICLSINRPEPDFTSYQIDDTSTYIQRKMNSNQKSLIEFDEELTEANQTPVIQEAIVLAIPSKFAFRDLYQIGTKLSDAIRPQSLNLDTVSSDAHERNRRALADRHTERIQAKVLCRTLSQIHRLNEESVQENSNKSNTASVTGKAGQTSNKPLIQRHVAVTPPPASSEGSAKVAVSTKPFASSSSSNTPAASNKAPVAAPVTASSSKREEPQALPTPPPIGSLTSSAVEGNKNSPPPPSSSSTAPSSATAQAAVAPAGTGVPVSGRARRGSGRSSLRESDKTLSVSLFPGFVIKTWRNDESDKKVFINVLHSASIDHLLEAEGYDLPDDILPYVTFGPISETEDKEGNRLTLYNVIVGSSYFIEAYITSEKKITDHERVKNVSHQISLSLCVYSNLLMNLPVCLPSNVDHRSSEYALQRLPG